MGNENTGPATIEINGRSYATDAPEVETLLQDAKRTGDVLTIGGPPRPSTAEADRRVVPDRPIDRKPDQAGSVVIRRVRWWKVVGLGLCLLSAGLVAFVICLVWTMTA